MTLLPCVHRSEAIDADAHRCDSPFLIGLKLVSERICNDCSYRNRLPSAGSPAHSAPPRLTACLFKGVPITDRSDDFACLHSSDRIANPKNCRTCEHYLFPVLTPQTDRSMVAAMFRLASRPQPAGWWRWPNVQAGFRLATEQVIDSLRTPFAKSRDRGIVIAGGGAYLASAYVTIRLIRHLGCKLPIQLWHFRGEVLEPIPAELARYDVTPVDADAHAREHSFPFLEDWRKGWQLKPYAIAHCPFREVLFLDADCYPVRDPEEIFDSPAYTETGALFWPDLASSAWLLPAQAWAIFGVEPGSVTLESGQLLIDTVKNWKELQLTLWYNARADYVYRLIWGDKDTFNIAWRRLGKSFGLPGPPAKWDAHTILQHGPDGRVLFQHRCQDKFRLQPAKFESTGQVAPSNRHNSRLAHEDVCFEFLEDLRRFLDHRVDPVDVRSISLSLPAAVTPSHQES
jgi:Mannosyltransferase putative